MDGGHAAEVLDQRASRRPNLRSHILENDPLRDLVEPNRTTRRHQRKARLDLLCDLLPRATDQGAVANVEAIVGVGLSDEVEHCQDTLALRPAQAPAKLLEEDGRALGRSQKQDRVDLGNVDALVEDVDREDRPNLAPPKSLDRVDALPVGDSIEGDCRNPASVNCSAMKRAWSTPAQNPSARIFEASSTHSSTASRIRFARTWSPVRTPSSRRLHIAHARTGRRGGQCHH